MGRKRHGGSRKPTRSQRRPGLTGTVRLTDAGGVVETAEGQFRLTSRGVREAMNGDTAVVSLHRGPHGERRAVIENVVERAQNALVGTYGVAGPLGVVHPLDTRVKADFFVLPRDTSAADAGVEVGDVVQARIVSHPTRYESGVVTIERRLGTSDAPDVGIRCVMARFDLEDGYPAGALEEANGLALDIAEALRDPLRRDIRERFALTIDPVDARDFDDALSLSSEPDGGWRLGVHIADVSHYVAWGSSIDLEARRRGTSVYLADRVLPMLPERLSCDLCSLRPGEDRLAFTVDMRLDKRGRLRDYRMYPSVMRSRVRLSYDEADALIACDDGTSSPAGASPHVRAAAGEGVDLAGFLRDAYALSKLLQDVRHARGAVDFDTVEIHALLDGDGRPVELAARRRTPATGLVEEAMLLANECVADYLARDDVAAAYRVHEPPTPDHLHAAAEVLQGMGAVDRQQASAIASGDVRQIQRVLADTAGTPASEVANALLLRAMQRALYKPHNEGHYALGAQAYCHFTSPIRRYPDLVVHRVLKGVLARERLGAREAKLRAGHLVGTGRESLDAVLPQVCRSSSDRERLADAAAHASQKVKVAQYYADRIGERLAGVVSWIDQLGVFVRLDETHAEGLVHMSAVGDEWFDFDERALALTGASTGRRIQVGDRVVVEIAGVNQVRGHLNLSIVSLPSALRHALH